MVVFGKDDRVVKEIAWREPDFKKRKGRPRKRWKEAAVADLREKIY